MFLKKVMRDFLSPKLPHKLLNDCLTLEAQRFTQALPVHNFTVLVVLLSAQMSRGLCSTVLTSSGPSSTQSKGLWQQNHSNIPLGGLNKSSMGTSVQAALATDRAYT